MVLHRLTAILIAVMVFLVIASMTGMVAKLYINEDWLHRFIRVFDLNTEINIPSIFSTFLLMLCAGAVAANAKFSTRLDRPHWYILSLVFTFLAADEFLSFHERLTTPIRAALHTSGLLYFAWIIPYGLAACVGAVFYVPFLFRLPKSTRNGILLAGAIYLSGAVGIESFEGAYFERNRNLQDVWFEALTTAEETLEMLGAIIFLDTLLANLHVTQIAKGEKHKNPSGRRI
jgi:hypothetical protein